jgi:nucleotide-binding universal stress UspA family protein
MTASVRAYGKEAFMNLSCIVCASDSSDMARSVVASAMALAEWEDAELHVVQLADPVSERNGPSLVVRERSTTVVRGGDPARAVIDHARNVRADLIVVGATLAAPATSQPVWLPEVISRDAHCPTLIVPLVTLQRREELPFRNVLCPVDFSPNSVIAYERALTITQRAGGTLTLLHVVDEFRDRSGEVRILAADERQLRVAEARGRLRLAISEGPLNWCHVGFHVSAGAADVHILAEARRLNADLIVMGLTSRANTEFPTRLPLVVGRVAAQAACPVLVVRATPGAPGWDEAYDTPEGSAIGPPLANCLQSAPPAVAADARSRK